MREDIQQTIDHIGDASAVTVGVSTFLGLLPAIAALFTIIWLGVRIWEAITGETFHHSWVARTIVRVVDWFKK